MYRSMEKSWPFRLTVWFLAWVTYAFIYGVIFGTVAWFLGNLLGQDWDYFAAVRTWIIGIAIVDFIRDIYKYGTRVD